MLDTVRQVETPEGIEVALRPAGPPARLGAWLIDEAIRSALYFAFGAVLQQARLVGFSFFVLFVFLVEWFYPVFFEVFMGGATPGKRRLGLVVVQKDGTPVAWSSSLVRNLALPADFLPLFFGCGLLSMLIDDRFRRLGDLAAGTLVVRRPEPIAATAPRLPATSEPLRPPIDLQPDEQLTLIELAERSPAWTVQRAGELSDLAAPLTGATGAAGAQRLAGMARWIRERQRESFGERHESEWQQLERDLVPVEAARRWRLRRRRASESADSVHSADSPASNAAADTADAANAADAAAPPPRQGGDAAGGPLPFPDLLRQVCHQLALVRSRRYGGALERRLDSLALRGHQQLYRGTGVDLSGVSAFFRGGFAARVRREGRLLALSALLLFGAALLTAGAVAVRPELAYSAFDGYELERLTEQFSPPADPDASRQPYEDFERFCLYIWINIGLAFRTFASGILFGVGSIFVLVYNGVIGGALAQHVHQMGFDRRFYAYIIGHGALELTAIVLAGLCGLRLGLSALAPGRLSRARALMEAAHRTLPILYGVTAMLIAAAFIEAFWSAATWTSSTVKLAAGGCLWAAVIAYFAFAGRRLES